MFKRGEGGGCQRLFEHFSEVTAILVGTVFPNLSITNSDWLYFSLSVANGDLATFNMLWFFSPLEPWSNLISCDFFSTLGLLGLRPRTWRQWKAVHRRGGESRGEGAERAQWVDNHVTQVLRPLTTGVPLVGSNGGEGGDWHKWMPISQGWAGIPGNESLWVPFPKIWASICFTPFLFLNFGNGISHFCSCWINKSHSRSPLTIPCTPLSYFCIGQGTK